MKEKEVYRLSVFFAVLGLSLVFASDHFFEPEQFEISEIDESMVGEVVQIKGEVVSYFQSGSNSFIDLKDSSGEIDLVEFDNDFDISEGDKVTAEGRVDLYEGDLQVIAERIED